LTSVAVQPGTAEATAPTGTSPFIVVGTFNQAPMTDDVTAQWSSSALDQVFISQKTCEKCGREFLIVDGVAMTEDHFRSTRKA
jgi:hypothetical protein